MFPVFLRLIIWIMFKLVPKKSQIHHTLAFLLHHPRRCFILIFPSINTWYLLFAQVAIDLILWFFFGILDFGYYNVATKSAGNQTIMGLFQALGTRVAGFYVILLSNVAPAMQILYVAAMYISGLPIIISLRQTNVYEERSLGVEDSGGESEDDGSKQGEKSYLGVSYRDKSMRSLY